MLQSRPIFDQPTILIQDVKPLLEVMPIYVQAVSQYYRGVLRPSLTSSITVTIPNLELRRAGLLYPYMPIDLAYTQVNLIERTRRIVYQVTLYISTAI